MNGPSNTADIVLFGEALVDVFAHQAVVGGAPFNVARHLAALGLRPLMLTRIGRDENGQRVIDEFKRFNLSREGLQIDDQRSTGTVRVSEIAAGQHRFEILRDQAYDAIDVDAAVTASQTLQPAIFAYGSLAQRSRDNQLTLQALLKALPATRFLDLNWREEQIETTLALQLLRQAEIVKLNDEELRMACQWAGTATTPPTMPTMPPALSHSPAIAELLSGSRVRELIVTYGAQGYAAFDVHGDCRCSGPAPAVPVMVDTVGAGDAFSAIVLVGERLGWHLPDTLSRAAAFASAICGLRGAVPDSRHFYSGWLADWGLTPHLAV